MPNALAEDIKDGDISMSKFLWQKPAEKLVQGMIYDDAILCASCDAKIGEIEDYTIRLFRNSVITPLKIQPYFQISNVNTDKIVRFCASVIWRCSISSRHEINGIKLNEQESKFSEIVFDDEATDISYPKVAIMRYTSDFFQDVKHLAVQPTTAEVPIAPKGATFFAFSLLGFRFVIKTDAQDWPINLSPGPINGQKDLRGTYVDLDRSTEFRGLTDIFKGIAKAGKFKQRNGGANG